MFGSHPSLYDNINNNAAILALMMLVCKQPAISTLIKGALLRKRKVAGIR
jgi:hypothetical protein